MHTHLRVARPTQSLERVARMYEEGLGLERLGSFADHEGFDGVMLGLPGAGYHLELTSEKGRPHSEPPSKENLLVLYIPDSREWRSGCERMLRAGFREVSAYNPYWDRCGRTFEDPDGYRVVLQRDAWQP